jgi:NADH-quinone oxidoreductase subunit H
LGKETVLPEGAGALFLAAPFLGLSASGLVAAMLGASLIPGVEGLTGDLIVMLYLLMIPAVALIIGASSSGNTLASVGASREIKLILAYELPFLLAMAAVIIKCGGAIKIGDIILHQKAFGANIISFSGALAFLVCLFCLQAKLGLVPFDASEAEQEIMAGVLIEYSGLPLAVFKLTRALMLYTMPLLLCLLFMGKDVSPLFLIGKYILVLLVAILIKNTNPRMRIDQILRFFWRLPALFGALAVILAVFGL